MTTPPPHTQPQPPRQSFWASTSGSLLIAVFALGGLAALWLLAQIVLALK